MLIVDGNITQGTHETAAGGTWYNCFFPGVIKAPGFLVHLKAFTGMTGGHFAVEGRIDIRPQQPFA